MSSTVIVLLSLSAALLVGLILTRFAKMIGLPAVTAYLVTGIIFGPFVLGKLGVPGLGFNTLAQVKSYSILCDLALGFIAFSIGNEFRLSQLKKIGKQATVIGIFQAVFTTVLVDIALIAFSLWRPDVLPIEGAIILGAVASATAPAATLMVIKQYKAKGEVTDVLLPVVALDDAVGLVLFAISFGVAKTISVGDMQLEVVLSLALGAVMGFLFNLCERFFHSRSKRMAVSVGFVMLTVAISNVSFEFLGVHFAFSSLLSCMMLGTIFCNICDFSEELMDRVDRWTAPLYILFFIISGAELDFNVFSQIMIILVGVIFIVVRSAGKYTGSLLSAKMTNCSPNIVKYLGITLLPQAGVAIGMATKALAIGEVGVIVQSVTLFAVLVYEMVGPYLTKIALIKSGDIIPEEKRSSRGVTHKI